VDRRADGVTPTVSVIIPHYSDLERLDLCLRALEAQTYPRDQFEIIVGDNASPQGEAAVAAAIAGRARLIVVTDRGAGPARNGAVAISQGRLLAFTDSDCVPEPEWLANGIAALSRFDFVGGQVTVLLSSPPHMTPPEAFDCARAPRIWSGWTRDLALTCRLRAWSPRRIRRGEPAWCSHPRRAICSGVRACGRQAPKPSASSGPWSLRAWPFTGRPLRG